MKVARGTCEDLAQTETRHHLGAHMDRHGQVAALFDRVATTYDQVGVDFFQPIAEGLVSALDPQPGEHALDIGCGRGAALLRLAAGTGPAGSVVGLDLSEAMVAAATAALTEAGLAGEVLLADAAAPPLPPETYDVISSSLVLFFLSEPADALAAWTALLRPGGRLGISTFGAVSPRWKAVDQVFDAYLPPQMLDARTSGAAGPFASDAGVAGLRDVTTTSMTQPVRFTDADQWYQWSWSTGQRRMWELVPEGERDAVRARASELLESTKDETGSPGFDQVVRYTLAVR